MRKSMKKIAAMMIALVAVVAVFATSIPVEAAAKAPKKITLKTTSSTVDIKGTATVSVKSVSPSSASKSVSFKSSNKKVATVSSKGVVTGKKAGKVTITVTSKKNKKVKKTIKITVKDLKPTSLSVSSKLTMYKGATKNLSTTVKPAGVYCPVSYSSSNSAVASVSSKGAITAKKAGTATITVKAKQKDKKGKYLTKTCKVTVLEKFSGEYVISAADAKKRAAAGAILVDTRGIDSKKQTAKGAITMSWQEISNMPGSGKAGHAVPLDAAAVSEKLSAIGIAPEDEIILFSADHVKGGWGDDGRIAWQLLACGYKNVKIVDGGLDAMKAAGIATQTGPSARKAKAVKIETVSTDHFISTEDLLANINDYKIIDVRADEEYNGEILYGETSGGHIKGAIHIRFTDLFNSNGTIKSVKELTKMFENAGLSKDDKIAAYCTGGIRSAYMQLVLQMCGYENSYNYAESAYRWSNTADAGTGDYWTKYDYISADKVYADISGEKTYKILDVRKAADYKTAHIEGSVSADVDGMVSGENGATEATAKANIKAAIKGDAKGTKYVIVCYSGNRYAQAATQLLIAEGVKNENILTLEGGMKAWTGAGYSTEPTYNYITADKVYADLAGEKTYKILDVRKAADYATSHIVGSVAADVDGMVSGENGATEETAKANIKAAIEGDAQGTVYAIVCYSGNRYAKAATKILIAEGVKNENILTLQGGMAEWNKTYSNYCAKSYTSSKGFEFKNGITVAQLKADVDAAKQVYTVFDLRSAAEYAEGHIKGAVSTPLRVRDEAGKLEDLSPNEGKANLKAAVDANPTGLYVLECYSGNAYANKAVGYLKELGVSEKQMIVLEGGASGWTGAGYPTVTE